MIFRTKPKERYLFASRKPRKRFPLVWFVVSTVLSLLVLELITRIVVDIRGNKEEFAQTTTEDEIRRGYELKFVDEQGEALPISPQTGVLAVKPSLSVGYQLVTNQEKKA